MTSTQQRQYEIGMVGLGVMGRNLVLNMADHGFSVAGFDKDAHQVEALKKESADRDVHGRRASETLSLCSNHHAPS